MDWIMAELVRLYHRVEADEAQAIIENLVAKDVPAVQEIDGQPVILTNLKPQDQVLLMLYRAGANGAELDELALQLRTPRKDHLRARLGKLEIGSRCCFIHPAGTTSPTSASARSRKSSYCSPSASVKLALPTQFGALQVSWVPKV
jgi:hypothetical protein